MKFGIQLQIVSNRVSVCLFTFNKVKLNQLFNFSVFFLLPLFNLLYDLSFYFEIGFVA